MPSSVEHHNSSQFSKVALVDQKVCGCAKSSVLAWKLFVQPKKIRNSSHSIDGHLLKIVQRWTFSLFSQRFKWSFGGMTQFVMHLFIFWRVFSSRTIVLFQDLLAENQAVWQLRHLALVAFPWSGLFVRLETQWETTLNLVSDFGFVGTWYLGKFEFPRISWPENFLI